MEGIVALFTFHFSLLYMGVQNTLSNWYAKPKTTQLLMQISQQALYTTTLSNQNYTLIHPPPPAALLHHFALICLPHISKSLFIGIDRGFYHFSYKKDGEYFPSFLYCCPFTAENWRNLRSLYFSFLTVTLACHYWGFLCPSTGSEAPRTKHRRDKGHQLHPLLLIHLFIPPFSSFLSFSSFHAWPDLATS